MSKKDEGAHSSTVNPHYDCALAFKHSLFSVIERLVKENYTNYNGNSILHLAIMQNRHDIFNHVLNMSDINVECLNHKQQRPLHLAARCYNLRFVTDLINSGANLSATDYKGNTPLHHIISNPNANLMLAVFANNGADLNAINNNGQTLLHLLIRCESKTIVNNLLELGVNLRIKDKHDMGAFEMALLSNNSELAELVWDYTVLKGNATICMKTLWMVVKNQVEMVGRVLRGAEGLSYDSRDLQYLENIIPNMRHDDFLMFVRRFPKALRELFDTYRPAISTYILATSPPNHFDSLENLLYLLDYTNYGRAMFANNSNHPDMSPERWRPTAMVLRRLVDTAFNCYHMTPRILIKLIRHLITVPTMRFNNNDIYEIFKHLGYGPMFDMVLERATDHSRLRVQCMCSLRPLRYKPINLVLLVEVGVPVDGVLNSLQWWDDTRLWEFMLYSAFPALKILGQRCRLIGIRERANKMPVVPALTELARNILRDYLILWYRIENSSDYYKVIKKLPIPYYIENVLLFREPLYHYDG